MPIAIEVLTQDGRPVVVKWADPLEAPRLRAEGARLAAARHPGVVEVLADGPVGEGWELRSVHAGSPVDVQPPRTLAEVAALGAGVAATLADLHDLGVVHGRLTAADVLVGSGGRPVLCGFGSTQEGAEPADDVAALGALLHELVGPDGEAEPIPERRWRRGRPWDGWQKRSLLTLADQAMADPASRRPTARRLAAALSELAPATPAAAAAEVAVVETDAPDDPMARLRPEVDPTDGPRVRPRSAVLAAIGVALVVVGVHHRASPASSPHPAAPIEAGPTSAEPSTTVAPAGPASCGPADGVDLDGDGCREAVSIDGTTVRVGDDAFEVGLAHDRLEIGDWDCDGVATIALLRPATGDVFVFPEWSSGDAVTVDPVVTVPGGAELVTTSTGRGCPALAVRTATGIVVDVTRTEPSA